MKKMRDGDRFITINEAIKLLNVSRPTFNKIRKQESLSEYPLGGRIRFLKSDILRLAQPVDHQKVVSSVRLEVLSDTSIFDLEISPNVFDFRLIKFIDIYATLSLLCTILTLAKENKRVELILADNHICQNLHALGFFYEIEQACKDFVSWDRSLLRGGAFGDQSTLLPMKIVKYKGDERRLIEKLISLLITQGFSPDVGGYIAWIMGELSDNALTHSDEYCYLVAKRYAYGESNCIIIGIADIGVGIHNSLKTNNKFKKLNDTKALLTAFKTRASSWDDSYNRGKGLTDVLNIAMGNNSFLRVDSGECGYFMDFRKKDAFEILSRKPMTNVHGTRFGLVLIDQKFKVFEREATDKIIDAKLEEL